ncbi:WD40-repeat-containing domain protein [Zopfochytrium polystomum]|nr:WD40-repeat-containing domain protein [Zopfochytrium polystomum]
MSTPQPVPFQLSAVLQAHTQDVRALAVANDGLLFSSSRDTRVLSWSRASPAVSEFSLGNSYLGHSHFVNSLVYIPPHGEFTEGLVASGGADKVINVFDVRNPAEPAFVLVGHTDTVCTLALAANGDIISGSWDKTARVWRNGSSLWTMTGHEQAVWAVLELPGRGILTASADKLIKLWSDGQPVQTMRGHRDVVRALALVASGFASVSNDSTVRIWNYQGDCVRELSGHTAFVYGLAAFPSGQLASCGEDRSLRIWDGTTCVQTITHPCVSVWCVAVLPNGDVATGGSDGVVRIFTRAPERIASEDDIKTFDAAVASQALPSNQVGDVDKSKLPGLDALLNPGRPDQVIMVRNGDIVEAHQWDATASQWQKIGEVVDAVGSSRKQVYMGREYDYVFDIDIGAGQNLKLPYNVSENPYMTAQRFIDQYELSQDFLEQIANFIIQNTSTQTIGQTDPYANVDPFTGASRYVPGSSGQAAPPPPPPAKRTLPITSFSNFQALNVVAVKNKVSQFQSEVSSNSTNGLTDEEFALIAEISAILQKPATVTAKFTAGHYKALQKIMLGWPVNNRFPAIDLLRVIVLHTELPASSDAMFIENLFTAAQLSDPFTPGQNEANVMLSLRLLCNLFATEKGRAVVFQSRDLILGLLGKNFRASTNSNLRVAYVTLILNLAVLFRTKQTDHYDIELLSEVIEVLKKETDAEVERRAVSALGTIITGHPESIEAAGLLEAKAVLSASKNVGKDTGLRSLQGEVFAVLR